jgi:hypothetical protein
MYWVENLPTNFFASILFVGTVVNMLFVALFTTWLLWRRLQPRTLVFPVAVLAGFFAAPVACVVSGFLARCFWD